MIPLFDLPEPEKAKLESGHVKKKRGRTEDEFKTEQREKAETIDLSRIEEVFQYWLEIMRGDTKRKLPKLDELRQRKIGWAVYDYGVEGCKQAIDGCAASDWHMGRNPTRRRYDSIELIFRNQVKVEYFMSLSPDAEDDA